MLYQSCYEDMHRRSDNAYEQRKKRKDAPESTEDPDFDQRSERDSSAKWTLVQLPFKIFSPILQTYVFFCCHSSRTCSSARDVLLYLLRFTSLPSEILPHQSLQEYQKFQRCQEVCASINNLLSH